MIVLIVLVNCVLSISQMPFPSQDIAINDDLARLRDLINHSMSEADICAPSGDNISLLNLACGRADETGVLTEVFGKQSIQITGLDIRDRELDIARDRWAKSLPKHANAEFYVQNGTCLDEMKELPKEFDLAFMRHQNYWNGDTTWSRIYDQALHRLDEKGLLIITSYFDREHTQALNAIKSLGAEVLADVRNPLSRVLNDVPGKSVDRHLAIFRKP